jgi:hypothetical protein
MSKTRVGITIDLSFFNQIRETRYIDSGQAGKFGYLAICNEANFGLHVLGRLF